MLTSEHLDFIVNFEGNAKRVDFHAIFGEHLGNHLWRKFVDRDHSFVLLWCGLDIPTAKRLLDYVNQQVGSVEEKAP